MTVQHKSISISEDAYKEMSNTLLDNWKQSDVKGLRERADAIMRELSWLEHKQRNLREENKVIWYFIAKREALE